MFSYNYLSLTTMVNTDFSHCVVVPYSTNHGFNNSCMFSLSRNSIFVLPKG